MVKQIIRAGLLAVVFFSSVLAARAQDPAIPDYQLGPGDVLSIRVSGVTEFQRNTRVSNSGRVRVPYVGVMLVAGLTTMQLEKEIARLIRDHELVNEPSVVVLVEEYRARPAYVLGDVVSPGQFVITGEMYLLDLLTKAGGVTGNADNTALLYRGSRVQPAVQARVVGAEPSAGEAQPAAPSARPADAGAGEVLQISLDKLAKGTDPSLNLRLQGGDVLYVPRRKQQVIYIIGDVKAPGPYTLPRRGEITAAQAVIYAGGPLPAANTGKAFIMRRDPANGRQAVPLNFSDILAGKEPDVPVKPDDIIYVPNSTIKSIGQGLLTMVPRLIQQLVIF